MHKRKTFFILALALILATACSLTNQATRGAAVVKTPPGTPTASATPEIIATPTPSPQRCTVDTGQPQGRVNLRACPGTGCGVIEVLEEGDRLQVVTLGDWLKVQTEAGAVGFVNSNYCTLTR
jgi:hypothetical protein